MKKKPCVPRDICIKGTIKLAKSSNHTHTTFTLSFIFCCIPLLNLEQWFKNSRYCYSECWVTFFWRNMNASSGSSKTRNKTRLIFIFKTSFHSPRQSIPSRTFYTERQPTESSTERLTLQTELGVRIQESLAAFIDRRACPVSCVAEQILAVFIQERHALSLRENVRF